MGGWLESEPPARAAREGSGGSPAGPCQYAPATGVLNLSTGPIAVAATVATITFLPTSPGRGCTLRASECEEGTLEAAWGETEGDAERLLRYACGRGWHRHAERATGGEGLEAQTVVPMVSLANPVRPLLRRMGFVEEVSTPHIMVRVLRPDQIFHRLADGSDLLDTLSLTAWTPHRTVLVNDPPHPRYTVQLETKESMLARLCCCRLDLDAALDMEWVRWNGRDPGLRRGLCEVFAFADWVQWFTDYV